MELPELLTDGTADPLTVIATRLALAVVILLAVYVIRRLKRWIAGRIIRFIDRVIERARKTTIPLEEQLTTALMRPLDMLINTIGLWLAIAVTIYDLPGLSPWVTRTINGVATSLIAVAVFWALFRMVDVFAYYFRRIAQRYPAIDDVAIRFGAQLSKFTVVLLAIVIIADEWGYNLTVLLTSLGLGGLAVSLAAQDSIANLIGYFAIMSDRPFSLGDFIVTNDFSGTVETIGFRSTRIRQLDQSLVVVPNKTVASASITNWAHVEKRRLNMTLRVLRGTRPEQLLAVVRDIREMLLQRDKVLTDTVVVQFVGFGENALEIMIICMLDIPGWAEFQSAKEEINVQIMHILSQHGVRLAVPQAVLLSDAPGGLGPGAADQQMALLSEQADDANGEEA